MDDSRARDSSGRPEAPLYAAAALGMLGVLLGRSTDPDHPHFWALTIISILVNAAIVAVCVYALIQIVPYLMSTSGCQQMGSC
ncbi:MAG TPA: hypothetical protein VFH56_01075 [Acidimicrobiales bacterium]|nr:hypothetical protein [Acidimicrobiales bacterium]